MMISTKGRYALRVMLQLAYNDPEKYTPLKDIAKNQDISEKYLESIIKILVQNGLVTGLRGKGGGYRLTNTPESYTLGEILKLTEGSLAPVACLKEKTSECSRSHQCPTLPIWQGLNEIIDNYLEGITLKDLSEQTSVRQASNKCE